MEVIRLTERKILLFRACITATAVTGMMFSYLFIIMSRSPEAVTPYCLTLIPVAAFCVALTVLSYKCEDAIPFAAILFLAFLLVSGNAYQVILGEIDYTKIAAIHTFAAVVGAVTLLLYVYVIKKRLLISKKGYLAAIIGVGATILALLLLLFAVGSTINGAKLWISFGETTLQLSEIVKLLFYVLLALIYNSNAPVKHMLIIGLSALAATSLLLVLLNEFGTVMLLAVVYAVVLFTLLSNKYSLLIIGGFALATGAVLLLVFGTHETMASQTGFIPDKLNKIYMRLTLVTLADNDQLTRALQGMINGGWFGASSDYKVDVFSLQADFAPAGIAQYFGNPVLVICIASVCGLFYTVYLRGRDSELNNRSGFKLAYIFAVSIAVQAIFSLGGNIGVLPCTGIGFPALSWGGTQMTALYIEAAFIVYGLQIGEALPERSINKRRRFYVEEELCP